MKKKKQTHSNKELNKIKTAPNILENCVWHWRKKKKWVISDMEHDVIPTETQKTMPQWKWREIGSERQRAFFLPYRNLLDIRFVRRALAHSRAHINRNFHYDSDKPNKSSKTCCMQLQTIFFSLDFIRSLYRIYLTFCLNAKLEFFAPHRRWHCAWLRFWLVRVFHLLLNYAIFFLLSPVHPITFGKLFESNTKSLIIWVLPFFFFCTDARAFTNQKNF